jgi:plasmid stabilization system protein ParE
MVRFRPDAERDVLEAATWYSGQRRGLGHEFLDALWSTVTAVAESPLAFPTVHRGTRRALMRRFPFGLYYRVEDSTIVVIAVMHASRDPHRWRSRA